MAKWHLQKVVLWFYEGGKSTNATSKTTYNIFVSVLMRSENTLAETQSDRRFSNWKRLVQSQWFLQLKQMLLSMDRWMMTHLFIVLQSALALGTIPM